MHRYREFGLISERDEVLRRAFRDGFKRAGLSSAQFSDALAWYRDHAMLADDESQLAEAFGQFASGQGWTAEQRDRAIDLHKVIGGIGPESVMLEPQPDDDRAVLNRADDLLRNDPARYWGDSELQDAVFEARERLNDSASTADDAPTQKANGDRQRIDEIEALLRDPSGDGQRRYWADAGLRSDYGQALARLHAGTRGSDGDSAAPSSATSAEGGPVPANA